MASLRRIDALHKFESNSRFVAELVVSTVRIFHKDRAALAHAARTALRMPALLHPRGALECRSCSKPASSHSTIRASAVKAPRALRHCAPNSSAAGSTASWCRAPTVSRTNICRRAKSGWPGSPDSPARPAPPSCWRTAPLLFVDGRYTVQAEAQVDGAVFAIEHLVESPPDQWLEQNLNRRRQARLRSVAAHSANRRKAEKGLRRCGRRIGGGR